MMALYRDHINYQEIIDSWLANDNLNILVHLLIP
jgi:hypothetical protein